MRAETINKILIAGLLSVVVLVPVLARRDNEAIQEKLNAECVFPDSELPNEFAVHAAGWYTPTRWLDFQIDQSGDMARQMDLMVHSPLKPVVLMFGNSNPTIYNLQWTRGTDIMAVVATGYHRQAVAGLPDETPVLISTYANGAKCGYFTNDPTIYGYDEVNSISQQLLGQSVEIIDSEQDISKWIGEPPEDKNPQLFSSSDTTVDSFKDPTAALAGEAGIKAALKKGILRRATQKDAEAWIELQKQLHPGKEVSSSVLTNLDVLDAYVVTDNFTYPNGMHAVIFFIPEDVPEPSGNPFGAGVFNFNTGKCSGTLCDIS